MKFNNRVIYEVDTSGGGSGPGVWPTFLMTQLSFTGRSYNGQYMARKPRLEVEGGLYHVTTRGVERRGIFHDEHDYRKFLSLLAAQKEKLPFFL